MNKNFALVLVSALSTFAASGTIAVAQGTPPGTMKKPAASTTAAPAVGGADSDTMTAQHKRRHGADGGSGRLRAILNPDQTKQYDAILEEQKKSMGPLIQQRLSLESQQQSGSKDPKINDKIADLQNKERQLRHATHEKAMALLTPEQKVKFEESKGHGHGKWSTSAQPAEAGGAMPGEEK